MKKRLVGVLARDPGRTRQIEYAYLGELAEGYGAFRDALALENITLLGEDQPKLALLC